MLSKLAIIAIPLLLAESVAATIKRYGKIDIQVNGTDTGCLGPDALWNIDNNCETYALERDDGGCGDECNPNWEWQLKTTGFLYCGGNPMKCNKTFGKYLFHHKMVEDGDVLDWTKTFATAMPQTCGVVQLLSHQSPHLAEFPITLIWREQPNPNKIKGADIVRPTITQKLSPASVTCTETSTVPVTTTNAF